MRHHLSPDIIPLIGPVILLLLALVVFLLLVAGFFAGPGPHWSWAHWTAAPRSSPATTLGGLCR